MSVADDVSDDITTIFNTVWNERDGQVVPSTDDVVLTNGAVKLDAVLLYADLAHSTELVRTFSRSVAAKVIRAYLSGMTRMVRHNHGEVRSFDGDRVMGVFVGDGKNSNAGKCALNMNYILTKLLRPKAEAKFPSLVQKGFRLEHCVGISRSEVLVVRAGIRGNNDLVFIGSAPNIAAKLSDIRNDPWNTYVTWNVYNKFRDDVKIASDGKTNMWQSVKRTIGDSSWDCYKSSYWRKP